MENEAVFMSITSVEDPQVASTFLEMAGGNLEHAVSLYFEHGVGVAQAPTSSNSNEAEPEQNASPNDVETDAQLAERLQNEMYQGPNTNASNTHEDLDEFGVRRPIQPTRETLLPQDFVYNNHMMFQTPQQSMFGASQRGIFNQTDENQIIELDSDSDENSTDNNLTSTQRRLANIFRPPWDLITKASLDQAKLQARNENKWILINIQDVTDFRCQVLNRDFWSSRQIKNIVEDNFIFLQYHHDSPNGEAYRNLYPFAEDEYPHIAILDPITGEQMLKWNEKPEIHYWIDQVTDFLSNFKLHTANVAPTSQGQTKSHAIALDSDDEGDLDDVDSGNENDFYHDVEEIKEPQVTPIVAKKLLTYNEQIKSLEPKDIPDPESNGTRIQIRSGIDGKRVVKALSNDTRVIDLFNFAKLKFEESLNGRSFLLKMQRDNLWDKRESSVKDAGVAGSAIMLEVCDDDDEE